MEDYGGWEQAEEASGLNVGRTRKKRLVSRLPGWTENKDKNVEMLKEEKKRGDRRDPSTLDNIGHPSEAI